MNQTQISGVNLGAPERYIFPAPSDKFICRYLQKELYISYIYISMI